MYSENLMFNKWLHCLTNKEMKHSLYFLFTITWWTQLPSTTVCIPCHIRSCRTCVRSSYGDNTEVIMLQCHMWRWYKIKLGKTKQTVIVISHSEVNEKTIKIYQLVPNKFLYWVSSRSWICWPTHKSELLDPAAVQH